MSTIQANLCEWKYQRHAYAVAMLNESLEPIEIYYSPGSESTAAEGSALQTALKVPINNLANHKEHYTIEDDDSVRDMILKIEAVSGYNADYLYFYLAPQPQAASNEECVNLAFDMVYRISSDAARKFQYSIVPSSTYQETKALKNDTEWQDGTKVVTESFDSNLLNGYTWPVWAEAAELSIRMIWCLPLPAYLTLATSAEQSNLKYLVKTYYPKFNLNADPIINEIENDPEVVKWSKSGLSEVRRKARKLAYGVYVVNNPDYVQAAVTDTLVKFRACSLLGATVHFNFNEQNNDFVDLERVFKVFPLSPEVPFVSYRSVKDSKFLVDKRALNNKTLTQEQVQEWIDPKINTTLKKSAAKATSSGTKYGLAALDEADLTAEAAHGLSYKILHNQEARIYMTLFIYPNGRLELRVAWDATYQNSAGVGGGQLADLQLAVEQIRWFVTKLNDFNYRSTGKGKQPKTKITVPASLNSETIADPTSSTHIAFVNALIGFSVDTPLELVSLTQFSQHFSAYASPVTSEDTDKTTLIIRYRRLERYQSAKDIQRYLKDYVRAHPLGDLQDMSAEYRDTLSNNLNARFGLSSVEAGSAIREYVDLTSTGKRNTKRRSIGRDKVAKLLDRDLRIRNGIELSIIPVAGGGGVSQYKVKVMGADTSILPAVYHYLQMLIYCYRHRDELAVVPNGPLALLLKAPLVEPEVVTVADTVKVTGPTTATTRRAARAAMLGEEEEASESESESESEPESVAVAVATAAASGSGTASGPTPVAPAPAAPVTMNTILSLLELLRTTELPGILAGNYSRSCQPVSRHPVAISPELREGLISYLNAQIAKLRTTPASPARDRQLRELDINLQTLREGNGLFYRRPDADGRSFKTYFYFCPLSWNKSVTSAGDIPNAFPAWSPNNPDKSVFMNAPASTTWKNEALSRWNTSNSLGNFGDPTPHSSYVASIFNKPGDPCAPCCYRSKPSVDKLRPCTQPSANPSMTSFVSATSSRAIPTKVSEKYVLETGKDVKPGRYGFIPDALNKIFNQNDSGRQLVNHNMGVGFDYYLRKGGYTGNGNKFLDVLQNLEPSRGNLVEVITKYFTSLPAQEQTKVFASLKQGLLYRLFLPEAETPAETAELATALTNSNIPLSRFLAYLKRDATVNEDFLWDLVTAPGIITIDGFNLLICEGRLGGRYHKAFQLGLVKCPVGFNMDTLFDPSKKTVIIYKHPVAVDTEDPDPLGDHYELITHVKLSPTGDIVADPWWKPRDALIMQMWNYAVGQCQPIPDPRAQAELERQIYYADTDNIVDQILADNLQPVNSSQAIDLLKPLGITKITQLVDNYQKTVALAVTEPEGTSDWTWLPLQPTGLNSRLASVNIQDLDPSQRPELYAELSFLLKLIYVGDFMNYGYRPAALKLNPGLESHPNEPTIIGVILGNGLSVPVQPVAVEAFLQDERDHLPLPDGRTFPVKELLRVSQRELWYDEYLAADAALTVENRYQPDIRKVYAVRNQFESESYQRLRFELSMLITEKPDVTADFTAMLANGAERQEILTGLQSLLAPYVEQKLEAGAETELMTQALGPLNKSVEQLTEAEIIGYEYKYVPGNVRYECFNRGLDENRGIDYSCTQSGKLYINPINLVTGDQQNLDNYLARITEELLRIPMKRQELLHGEVDNLVRANGSEAGVDTYLIRSSDLTKDLQIAFDRRTDYRTKMERQFDIRNPAGAEEISNEITCRARYLNLPSYWLDRIPGRQYKIYEITGPNACIYRELDRIFAEYKYNRDQEGVNTDGEVATAGLVDTRQSISEVLLNGQLTGLDNQAGWELARDYYSKLFGAEYPKINNKEELINTIKTSERHRLNLLDLRTLSYVFGVRWIIINDNGLDCLGSTQTLDDRYIILYARPVPGCTNDNQIHCVYEYQVVKYLSSPEKVIFTSIELPLNLFHEWVDACLADNRAETDPLRPPGRSAGPAMKSVSMPVLTKPTLPPPLPTAAKQLPAPLPTPAKSIVLPPALPPPLPTPAKSTVLPPALPPPLPTAAKSTLPPALPATLPGAEPGSALKPKLKIRLGRSTESGPAAGVPELPPAMMSSHQGDQDSSVSASTTAQPAPLTIRPIIHLNQSDSAIVTPITKLENAGDSKMKFKIRPRIAVSAEPSVIEPASVVAAPVSAKIRVRSKEGTEPAAIEPVKEAKVQLKAAAIAATTAAGPAPSSVVPLNKTPLSAQEEAQLPAPLKIRPKIALSQFNSS
jgi:hypothetical protein